jgi:hypothetical protein
MTDVPTPSDADLDPDADRIGRPGAGRAPESPVWLRWWVLVLTFSLAGLAWSLMTPAMGAPDEPTYAANAVAFWSGQFRSQEEHAPDAKTLPFGNGRWFRIPEVWNVGYDVPTCFAFQPSRPAVCSNFSGSNQITDVPDSLFYTVQPAWLALTGWFGRLFPGLVGVYGMRIVSALAGAVLLAAAVRALAELISARLAVIGVLAAATPMTFFILGAVNPNGLEIAAAICLWAHALALGRQRRAPTHLLVGFAVSAVVLTFTRPLSPVFAGYILLAAAIVAGWERVRALWEERRARITGIVVVAAIAVSAASVFTFSRNAHGSDPHASTFAPRTAWFHTIDLFASFGWNDTPVRPVAILWLVVLGVLGVLALMWGTNRTRVALVLTALVTGLMLLINTLPASNGWQGRYELPVTVGVALISVVAIGERAGSRPPLPRWFLPGLAVVIAIGQVGAFYRALQRYTVGIPTSLRTNVFNAPWEPVGGAALPLALILAYAVLSTVLVFATSDEEVPAAADREPVAA